MPNLLFLYTDEQAVNTLACYGNRQIEMPHLNALAARSVVFDRAYVTQPVCTPSRSTLLTGLWPHTNRCTCNNVPLGSDTPCLPELLRAGHYATGHFGKWHLGDEIFAQHGFEEWRSIEDGYAGYYSQGRDRDARSTYQQWLSANGVAPADGHILNRGEATRLPEPWGKPAYLAAEASDFIRRHRHHPFVLCVNFLEPHMPYFGPRDDQYDPAAVPLPANFAWPSADSPTKVRAFAAAYEARGHSGLPLSTEAEWRRLIANYWGLNSLVDTHVGTILQTLEDSGLEDDTIVVFTSDHGDMMGSHRLTAKCVQYQEAMRVPMLVHLPGQRRQVRVPAPVSQIDLLPTLLDLMGEAVPDSLQGVSLRTTFEHGDAPPEDVVVEWQGANTGVLGEEVARLNAGGAKIDPQAFIASVCDPVRTLVTADGWSFTHSPLGEHQLYHLVSDAGELHNLAADPVHAPMLSGFRRRLRAWQERTGDTVCPPVT